MLATRILAFSIRLGWPTPIFLSSMKPSSRKESCAGGEAHKQDAWTAGRRHRQTRVLHRRRSKHGVLGARAGAFVQATLVGRGNHTREQRAHAVGRADAHGGTVQALGASTQA